MAVNYVVQPYALKRVNDDEKFGFSIKAQAFEEGDLKYLVITKIEAGSPAERAGLQVGMVVIDINGVPLVSGTAADAANAIKLTQPGMPLLMGVKVDIAKSALPRQLPALPMMSGIAPVVPQSPVDAAVPVAKSPPPIAPKPRQSIVAQPQTPTTPDKPRASFVVPGSAVMVDANDVIVIDNGAWQTKIGLATSLAPIIFPTICGRHKLAGVGPMPMGGAPAMFGSTAYSKKGMLKLNYLFERGIVKNWDDMESLWKYAFKDEMRIEPTGRPVIVTEPMFTGKEQREKMAEIMFEKIEVSALHIALSSLLPMYATGRNNDTIVVDIGDSLTQILPIRHDYNAAFLAGQKYSLAGNDVSERFAQLLSSETGHSFTAQDANLREIKEKFSRVAANAQAADQAVAKEKFTLPDGNVIEIGSERFKCTEIMFDPSRVGMTSTKGVHEAVIAAALKCDAEAPTLLQNIVLAGGSTMFPGFAERLESEVKALTLQNFGRTLEVKVAKERHGKLAAWLGGAAIAKLTGFQNQWITKAEYSEFGPTAVHRKSAPI